MASVYRTADHSIWFNEDNFQQNLDEGVLETLTALAAGPEVAIALNGQDAGIWARFQRGALALKPVNDLARAAWAAIPPGWVQIAPLNAGVPMPGGPHPAGNRPEVPPAFLPVTPVQGQRELREHVVYAVDVGSPSGGLAWARLAPHTGQPISGSMDYGLFIKKIIFDLRAKLPVALGFEAPIFLPVADDIGGLTRARTGEPSAWSYGAGAYTSAVAIPLMAHTLNCIRNALDPSPFVSLDASQWLAQAATPPDLLLWEAFVYGPGHAREPNAGGLASHVQDAATAANAFVEWEYAIQRQPSAVTAHNPFSTCGAAILWSRLGSDLALLHQQTLTLLPLHPTGGGVAPCTH